MSVTTSIAPKRPALLRIQSNNVFHPVLYGNEIKVSMTEVFEDEHSIFYHESNSFSMGKDYTVLVLKKEITEFLKSLN